MQDGIILHPERAPMFGLGRPKGEQEYNTKKAKKFFPHNDTMTNCTLYKYKIFEFIAQLKLK